MNYKIRIIMGLAPPILPKQKQMKSGIFVKMSIIDQYRPAYTYADYCQWEGRWELVEGFPYAMSPAPGMRHQQVNLMLATALKEAVRACESCRVYLPIDWKISDRTVIRPDVSVVCNQPVDNYITEAPALVAEILSPATAVKDRNVKMEIYRSQGVAWYLILDPLLNRLEIYEWVQETYMLAAVDPANWVFRLDGCEARVDFGGIWAS